MAKSKIKKNLYKVKFTANLTLNGITKPVTTEISVLAKDEQEAINFLYGHLYLSSIMHKDVKLVKEFE